MRGGLAESLKGVLFGEDRIVVENDAAGEPMRTDAALGCGGPRLTAHYRKSNESNK